MILATAAVNFILQPGTAHRARHIAAVASDKITALIEVGAAD
jgi:hypothetical protein